MQKNRRAKGETSYKDAAYDEEIDDLVTHQEKDNVIAAGRGGRNGAFKKPTQQQRAGAGGDDDDEDEEGVFLDETSG